MLSGPPAPESRPQLCELRAGEWMTEPVPRGPPPPPGPGRLARGRSRI